MSIYFVRLGFAAGLAMIVAGVIAGAQDGKHEKPPARDPVNVFNDLEGRTVVVSSVPEGARVEKGETICELDSSDLRDRLAAQEIVVRGAEADVHATRIGREVAVMAVNEYKEAGFRQQLAATETEIKLTEARLASDEDQVEWARRMFDKGYISTAEKVSDELALKQARFALEQAQSKKQVLMDYTKARTIKALTGAVEAARARELAKQASLERERSAQKRLTEQIRLCKVTAPDKGRIVYATPMGMGAVVHDGQLLCRVIVDGESKNKAK